MRNGKSGCRSLHAQGTGLQISILFPISVLAPIIYSADRASEIAEESVCVCVFERACQRARAWQTFRRGTERAGAAFLDHFKHFLLYLQQLLGEVEITARACRFDASPPLTAQNKGETHMLCPWAFRLTTYLQLCDVGPSLRSNH